ncbi:MAG: hypothetical protein H0W40_18305 [Methylibium sp.]|nr:hypothetical protein [Methylibium sp.]
MASGHLCLSSLPVNWPAATVYEDETALRLIRSSDKRLRQQGPSRLARPHERAHDYRGWADAKAAIGALPMKPNLTRVISAHSIGGCGLGGEERLGVVRPDGQRWQLKNLWVRDGSLFPASIGANLLSIYGIVNRLSSALAQRLSGCAVQLT